MTQETQLERAQAQLLAEVEALTRVYVGKAAESEQWGETCRRFDRLDKLAKRVRKAQEAAK